MLHYMTKWWQICQVKKKNTAADSWCLWENRGEGSMFLDHKIWGNNFDIFTKTTFDDFYPK